jgi:2-iminobutanoate/2-iminopropanoate deaminase
VTGYSACMSHLSGTVDRDSFAEKRVFVNTIESIDAGVASQIGRYADAVCVPAGHDQIIVSGTPGIAPDGSVPDNITDETTQAWTNIESILALAGAGLTDVVAVRQWLTDPDDVAACVAVRSGFIRHEPASMLAVVPALVRPGFKVEIEVIAARPSADSPG